MSKTRSTGAGFSGDAPSSPEALGLPDVDPRSIRPDTGLPYLRPRVRVTLTVSRSSEWSALLDGAELVISRDRLAYLPDGVTVSVLGPERDAERRTSSAPSREGTESWAGISPLGKDR
jgi:hypothetical protein